MRTTPLPTNQTGAAEQPVLAAVDAILQHSFVRFALVGASNTAIGLSVIYIAWRVFGLGDVAANVLGYLVGFCWSYTLNRLWTFKDAGPVGRSFMRFALICAAAYAVNLLVLFEARRLLGAESFLPHILGMVVYTGVSYLGSRFFAFKPDKAHRHDSSPP